MYYRYIHFLGASFRISYNRGKTAKGKWRRQGYYLKGVQLMTKQQTLTVSKKENTVFFFTVSLNPHIENSLSILRMTGLQRSYFLGSHDLLLASYEEVV